MTGTRDIQGSPDGNGSRPTRRSRVLRVVSLGVLLGGFGVGIWVLSPRSTEITVEPPCVSSYRPGGVLRAAVVCTGGNLGVINGDETFVPASGSRGPGGELIYLSHAEEGGKLRITKSWFGSYEYAFVAKDGTETQLKPENRYLGLSESL